MDVRDDEVWMQAAYRLGYEHGKDGREPSVPMPKRCDDCTCKVIDLMPYLMRLEPRRRASGGGD